jgi:hypothetical protein
VTVCQRILVRIIRRHGYAERRVIGLVWAYWCPPRATKPADQGVGDRTARWMIQRGYAERHDDHLWLTDKGERWVATFDLG